MEMDKLSEFLLSPWCFGYLWLFCFDYPWLFPFSSFYIFGLQVDLKNLFFMSTNFSPLNPTGNAWLLWTICTQHLIIVLKSFLKNFIIFLKNICTHSLNLSKLNFTGFLFIVSFNISYSTGELPCDSGYLHSFLDPSAPYSHSVAARCHQSSFALHY